MDGTNGTISGQNGYFGHHPYVGEKSDLQDLAQDCG